jgi:hypothetical protein
MQIFAAALRDAKTCRDTYPGFQSVAADFHPGLFSAAPYGRGAVVDPLKRRKESTSATTIVLSIALRLGDTECISSQSLVISDHSISRGNYMATKKMQDTFSFRAKQ